VIFDIVESLVYYITMEVTMSNERRLCRIYRSVLNPKKRRRVFLVSLPLSSIGQKRITGLKK
jgi:hypothetical protein